MRKLSINEVLECEVGTEFKVKYEDGTEAEANCEIYKDEFLNTGLRWIANGCKRKPLILLKDFLTAKFIQLPKEREVTFIEAVKAFEDGKTIICKEDEFSRIYVPNMDFTYIPLRDDENSEITSKEILEGKWFIKEE